MTSEELRDRTMRFAVRVVRFCRAPPETWEARRIGGQLIDSATSVAANYRVVRRARSRAEFVAKLGLVVEEADESAGWLELIARLEIGRGPELTWLIGESNELLAILGTAQKTARQNRQQPSSANQPIPKSSNPSINRQS